MNIDKNNRHALGLERREIAIRAKQGWLIPGFVHKEQFWQLVGISSMHSDKVINALYVYLVKGVSRKDSCHSNSVNSGHFSIALNRLQHISHAVAKLKEYY